MSKERWTRISSSPTGRLLLLSVVVTLLLYVIPYGQYLAYPLLLLSTVAHEMGHGLTALLVGASFQSLTMTPDGAGVATYTGNLGRVAQALVAAGGLLGPALVAGLAFALGRTERGARGALLGTGVFLLIACPLVVRGSFAWLFIGGLAVLLLVIGRKASNRACQATVIFLAIQLSLSVFSRSDYLFARSAGSMPSDVSQMAQALWLPYWFWGLVCGGISLAILVVGLRAFLRRL